MPFTLQVIVSDVYQAIVKHVAAERVASNCRGAPALESHSDNPAVGT